MSKPESKPAALKPEAKPKPKSSSQAAEPPAAATMSVSEHNTTFSTFSALTHVERPQPPVAPAAEPKPKPGPVPEPAAPKPGTKPKSKPFSARAHRTRAAAAHDC